MNDKRCRKRIRLQSCIPEFMRVVQIFLLVRVPSLRISLHCSSVIMAHATAAAAAAGVPSREELHRELMQLEVRIGNMHTQLVRIEAMVRSVVRAHGIPMIDEEAPGEARDAGARIHRVGSVGD